MDLTADGVDGLVKVRHILDNFDTANENKLLTRYLVFWMDDATEEKLFVDPPSSPSGQSDSTAASCMSNLTNDGLTSNPAAPVEVDKLYKETVRYTCLRGKCSGLDPVQIAKVTEEICHIRPGSLESFRLASDTTLDDAVMIMEGLNLQGGDLRGGDNEDSKDQGKDKHTISSSMSDNARAFSLNFISRKMAGWEKSKIDYFYKYCFR